MSYVALLDLEGLALNGFVAKVDLVDCESKETRRSKLVVKLIDGRRIETECLVHERIARSYLTILKYVELGRFIAKTGVDEETLKNVRFDFE